VSLNEILAEFVAECHRWQPAHECHAPATPQWITLKRIAEQATPKLRRAFVQAIGAAVNGVVQSEIVAALSRGSIDDAIRAVPWDEAATPVLQDEFMGAFQQAFLHAGRVAAKIVPGVKPFPISITDDRALNYLKAHGGELITDFGITNKAVIRASLVDAMDAGFTPQQTAKLIRPHIGLSEPYSRAVDNLARRLAEKDVAFAEIEQQVERYSRELIRARSMTIARTETQDAVGAGQNEAWLQAEDRGLIDGDKVIRRWITAMDDEVRPAHEFMEGQERGLHENFVDGDGYETARWPFRDVTGNKALGINCRCGGELDTGL
jgi:hypothetical protein